MKQKDVLKKVWKYLEHYRMLILLSFLFSIAVVVLTLYVPILVGRAIDQIVETGVHFGPIKGYLFAIGVLVLITAVLQWIMNQINNKVTYHVVRDIRKEAFDKLQNLPLKYIDSHSYGEIVSRMITDVDQFADGLLMGFTQLFTGIVTILGTLIIMLTLNVGITCVVVVVTPLSLFVANFIATHTYTMFREQSVTRGEQTALIDEMIGNAKVVKAFGQEEEAIARFDEINDRLQKCSLKAIFYSSLTNPSTRFINSLVYAGVGLTGAFAVIGGKMTVGLLSSFLSYSNQYTKPFNDVSAVITELQNAIACAGRIFELIEEKSQIPDAEDAAVLSDAKGNVTAEHVYFSYTPEQQLIQDFNLQVQPGQNIAIVGPTGCGKTTIINLLMRFYDVNSGSIKIDGHDVRDFNRSELREMFGMVLQDTWLFHGTIMDNIRYGKLDATEEEVIQAAKAAHVHRFVQTLPGGYQMEINEEATNISQGQKQLLTIARAILADPKILILDEATSSVDTRTEVRIQKAMDNLMKGRTSFVIAHRLSTIRDADLILVMKDGDIIEQGTHTQLLAKNGFYAELYNSQFESTDQTCA
mgnify:CR=1 FL=1